MNKDASQKREENRTLKVQASDIKGILREQRKSTKILSDIKELLKDDTKEPLVSQKTVTEKKEEIKQTAALLKAPVKKESYDDEEEQKSPEVDADIPDKPQKKTTQKTTGAARGVGMLGAVSAVAGVGAVLGGLVGLGFDKRSQLPETDEEAARRGVGLSKENPIFQKNPQGLAQVLDQPEFASQTRRGKKLELERKMQEAADTGPPKPTVVRQEQRRQEATQPQEFKPATERLSAAGYTSVPARARTQKQDDSAVSATSKEININFSEFKFAESDPENYERFTEFKNKRYREIIDEEKKKGFSQATARDIAEVKARNEAIIKFKKEIEAAGADLNKTKSQVQPASRSSTQLPTESQVESRTQELLQKYPEAMRSDPSVVRDAREEARIEISARENAPIISKPQADDTEDRAANLRAVAAQRGMSGRVSGSYEGGQLIRIKDESGREVDVSDQLTPDQRRRVDAARELRAANARTTDLQNQVTQSSAENRELTREVPTAQVQPIVVNNNNSMASQSYVPVQAQPRLSSTFSRLQDRSATY